MWTFALSSLAGKRIGELYDLDGRSVNIALNGASTGGFTIREDNAQFERLFKEDALIQVWYNGDLWLNGPVTSINLASQESGLATAAVGFADGAWRLSKRLAGKSSTGKAFTTTDKATIGKVLIEEANTANNTGIGFENYTCGSTASYTAGPYKSVLACIGDLSSSLSGFDWRIIPKDEGTTIGKYDAAAVYGSEKKGIVLEHGTGRKNCRNMTLIKDYSALCNKAFHLLEGSSTVGAEDATSVAARGLYEEVADSPSVTNEALRKQWVESVVSVRGEPRIVIGMSLDMQDETGRVPQVGPNSASKIWLGDRIVAHGRLQSGVELFNGLIRVYRIDVSINQNGTATFTPILVNEGGI